VKQFYADDFFGRSGEGRKHIIVKMKEILRPSLWSAEQQQWIADYYRIRVIAEKESA
jgi:hypothetical protein